MKILENLVKLPGEAVNYAISTKNIRLPVLTAFYSTPISLILSFKRGSDYLACIPLAAISILVADVVERVFAHYGILQHRNQMMKKLLVVSIISAGTVLGGTFILFPQLGVSAAARVTYAYGDQSLKAVRLSITMLTTAYTACGYMLNIMIPFLARRPRTP
jgi:hypothetical protein